MQFERSALIGAILILSLASQAQQPNGTFPSIIKIADKMSNSTARIADTLEASRAYLPEILKEIKLLREQGERSGELAEKITSLGYLAAAAVIIATTGVSVGVLFVAGRWGVNKYFVGEPEVIQPDTPTIEMKSPVASK